MTQPQPGDEVRVVIQGVVSTDWAKLESLIASVGGRVETLEVLPPPLKLGDVLGSSEEYARCPSGTVVKDLLSGVMAFRAGNWWYDTTDEAWHTWQIGADRTIVFLPDET